jgi:hypothetical protein
MAHHVHHRRARERQVNEPEVEFVERHLVDEIGCARLDDAELRRLAQVMVAQIVEIFAVIAHP